MHLCFIVENSLTMLQKTSNSELNIFDQIKHSLETVLKNVFRSWNAFSGKQPTDVIHLFVTSSTEPISSYVDNNEMHILHQIRNLECTIPTFAAEVIESALYHVGKFKCLNETETCLGYRQCNVSEPAFIFYITDNSNARQIQKINQKIIENKFHLRAEYKFITIKYCGSSPNEASLNNRDKFKSFVESQKQSLMMEEVMQKVNGKLIHTYSTDQLINSIQNVLLFKNYQTITIGLSNKQYKIYNKEIVKLQFPTPALQQKYMQRIRSLKKECRWTKSSDQSSVDLFVDCLQGHTRLGIPLPHQITPKFLSSGKIIIDQFEPLKYFVDFTKEYVGTLGQGTKYLWNIFQIVENKELLAVLDFTQEKKFPLFYEKDKVQYLIGYLDVYPKHTFNPLLSRTCELHISFSNFTNLNATIRSYFERNPSSDQFFQNYISTLPMFYHKTLKFLLSVSNIILSPQTERCFENIHNKPIGVTNLKLYEQRLAEKSEMINLQKESMERHQSKNSKCCSIYSQNFQQFQAERSQFYSASNSSKSTDSKLTKYFQDSIQKLTQFQPDAFLHNYFTPPQISSSSMTFQVKKYSNIRRNDQEMDKLVGGIFGNPFRKINKKVKLHVEAESVWVEPEEVGMMKQLMNKEMEVYTQMLPELSSEQVAEMDNIMKMESIYDRLAGVKGIIADAVKKVQTLQQMAKEKVKNPQIDQQRNPQKVQDKPHKDSNLNQIQTENIEQSQQVSQRQQQKMVQQGHESVQMSTEQLNEQQQRLMFSWMDQNRQNEENKMRGNDEKVNNKYKEQIQSEKMVEQSSESFIPEIIEEVNNKFPMVKSVFLEIPTYLVRNDLYTRNKAIINDTLLAYLGLMSGSK